MAALGFQLGLRQKPLRLLTLLLVCMWTATMTVILDMGSARIGNVRIGTQAYDWTIQGFSGRRHHPAGAGALSGRRALRREARSLGRCRPGQPAPALRGGGWACRPVPGVPGGE